MQNPFSHSLLFTNGNERVRADFASFPPHQRGGGRSRPVTTGPITNIPIHGSGEIAISAPVFTA
ncbi:conserved hypothetical protein [Ricinus communis]|uniref:Uncharacterized protein n=1 Tax=Ricinus communis TaxID=3988 RepID=B9T752_RICCO|nr:conserved hypothetical protein [Ricinus communis]